MRVVYFDCFSGMSSKMALASLIDAGADSSIIEQRLNYLSIARFSLHFERVIVKKIPSLKLDISHEKDEIHMSNFPQIAERIENSYYSKKSKKNILSILEKIFSAYSRIGEKPMNQIKLNEVLSTHSFIATVGLVLALEALNIEQIYSSPIPIGFGKIKTDIGIKPVPDPIILEILRGVPINSHIVDAELTTAAGAGIIAGTVKSFKENPALTIEAIGYGAGTHKFLDRPNMMRSIVGTIDEMFIDSSAYQFREDHIVTSIQPPQVKKEK